MNILRKIREVDRALNEGLITYEEAANLVEPFKDAEPVIHSYWSLKPDGKYMCVKCNNFIDKDKVKDYKYCPYCGAKMDEK